MMFPNELTDEIIQLWIDELRVSQTDTLTRFYLLNALCQEQERRIDAAIKHWAIGEQQSNEVSPH